MSLSRLLPVVLGALALAGGAGQALPPAMAQTVPAPSEAVEPIRAFTDLMMMDGVLDVMRAEGLANGAELAADLPGGATDPGWQAELTRIYDTGAMRETFDKALAARLSGDPQALAAATEFFGSELGQRVLKLEIDARRTLLDKEVEKATELAFEDLVRQNPARVKKLERFAEVNDLVESNVMGALNANLAFFTGIADEGGKLAGMDEQEMLATVWEGEAQTRADTQRWLYPFLMLAYQPLPDGDLEAYTAFSDTPEGRRMNAAVFAAFDALFTDISHRLGEAYARRLTGQDI